MISLLIRLVALAARVLNIAMLAYCVMSFVMPQSDLFRKLASMIEPILYPVRKKLYGWFPSLRSLPVDLSPLALWLLIDVVQMVLNMLR